LFVRKTFTMLDTCCADRGKSTHEGLRAAHAADQ
jgi:hypothetical protein